MTYVARTCGAFLLAVFSGCPPARLLADPPPAAPSPAPPAPYVSIEDEISPTYDAASGASTLLNIRGQLPYTIGAQYVLRFKLPVVTRAPSSAITGAGDLALFDLAVLPAARSTWLAGITVRVPTAQNDALGSGKYSIGPAFGYAAGSAAWKIGFFSQNFFSVVGPSSRTGVAQSKLDPQIAYELPHGWSVGNSTMTFTYDWIRNKWTEVPLGVGVAKQFGSSHSPLDAAFEIEKNLAHVAGVPGWTIRTLLKWTLPR